MARLDKQDKQIKELLIEWQDILEFYSLESNRENAGALVDLHNHLTARYDLLEQLLDACKRWEQKQTLHEIQRQYNRTIDGIEILLSAVTPD